jgi:hypothetical protein
MLQVVIDKDLLFDFQNYCDDNNIKYTEAVRLLLRDELYIHQRLCKRVKNVLKDRDIGAKRHGK